MKIIIKKLGETEHTIDLPSSSRVLELKHLAEKLLKVNVKQLRLVYQGKALEDGKTLEESKLKENAKVYVMMKKEREQEAAPEPLPTVDLWEELGRILNYHYGPVKGPKVLQQVQKEFGAAMQELSLDDIERLAFYKLNSTST